MLPVSKHFTPVVGMDIHFVIIPPGTPVPIPHPFVGMVFDPADYFPFVGSTVNVNQVPIGNSGSSGMIGTVFHIPMGGPFLMAATIGHDSINYYGNPTVNAEGSFLSPSGYPLMTCNDIGIPLGLSPGKRMKPKLGLYAPTSNSIASPGPKPVFVGGPYVPDVGGMLTGMAMSYGMGGMLKGANLGASKALKQLNHKVLKKFKSTKGLSSKLCKFGFEPVDLITGRMVYEGEDFRLPGVIPIHWERRWYSDSEYNGYMGYGYHNNYDLSLFVDHTDKAMVLMLPDGRATAFPLLLNKNETFYNRAEKLTLTCQNIETYLVKDHSTNLVYTFKKMTDKCLKPVRYGNDEAAILFKYNDSHHLNQIIDTVGRVLNLELDERQRVTQISVTHKGIQKTLVGYRYSEEGDLVAIIDTLNQEVIMEYENHLMIKKTDRNGQAFYWEYDGKKTGAKCVKTWGDGGLLSGQIEYQKNLNIVTNSLGNQTLYYYNEENLCTQVTDPKGNHIFHEYTDFMEPYRDIDEEGFVTGYSYDSRGNLTSLHQPDDSVVTYVYDDEDRLILTKNPEGATFTRVYEKQRLHAIIDSAGAVTSFKYLDNGLIHSTTNDAGKETIFQYDDDFNIKKMIFSDGTEAQWRYDQWGRCVEMINAAQHKQIYSYDALDRVERIQQSDKNIINLKYNAYDDVIESSDSKNRKVQFEYTPIGQLKMRTEKGRKVEFKYNTETQLQAVVNEHNEFYRFGRNEKGEIINETGYDGLRREFERDRAGKIIKIKRPNNRFTEFEYNSLGKVTRAEYYDGTWETFSYDRNGDLIEAVNQNTKVQLLRDEAGRVVKEIQEGCEVESEFNSFSLRTKIKSSLGAEIDLKYNDFGAVEQSQVRVTQESLKKTKSWQSNSKYNSLGQEIERQLPGGVKSTTTYDFAGRPIHHKVSSHRSEIRNRSYVWNVNDQLHKMVDQLNNGVVHFGYDDFGYLASAQYENHHFDYKLPDEVGNLYRTTGKTDRKYGPGGQLLESDSNKFKYDEEGNLIQKATNKGVWNYTWYGNGMLQSVIKPNNQTIAFEYDALGRRTAKINYENKEINRYIYNGNVLLHEFSYALEERPKLVADELGRLSLNKEEDTTNLITWVFDEGTFVPQAKITNEGTFSIISDYLGAPILSFDEQGNKVWERELDIYGKVRKGDSSFVPFLYQGQYYDEETELAYNRFRYYSPDTGMYISQDPIGLLGNNPNFYAYVHDVNSWIDPFGLDCIRAKMKIAANAVDPKVKSGKFTKAGRSLDKHGQGSRSGNTLLPKPVGNPETKNKVAAEIVNDIVDNGTIKSRVTGKGMKVIQVVKSNGLGIVFEDLGEGNVSFKYFGENLN